MAIGVQKIKIPIKQEELTIDAIQPYLPTILSQFNANAIKITSNYEQYLGKHTILSKTRPYDSDSAINNIVSEPHLLAMVDFKCGYTLGNPKEYAQIETKNTDDIGYLQKYFKDCDLRTVDNDVTKWVYATGVGYYFIQPKSRLPKNDYESPFEVFCQPSNTCCKVYSSYVGEKPLFDCVFTQIKRQKNSSLQQTFTIIDIYMPNGFYEYEVQNGLTPQKFNLVYSQDRPLYKFLPLVEKYSNSDRLGIVEICKTLQYAIDKITSNELDNIDEVVNQLYVFVNVMLGKDNDEKLANFLAMKKNGVAEIMPSNPQFPAELKTLSTNLDHKNIMKLKETLTQVMYDCCGVPLASSSVSSGGDTQGARQLGNGWENAYTVILKDINNLIKADRELLKIMLWISKQSQYSKINELEASDIDIKYNINRSNNLLTKTQSYVNLSTNNVPPSIAMALCELTSDPEAVGRAIEEYKQKQLQETQTLEQDATETVIGISE